MPLDMDEEFALNCPQSGAVRRDRHGAKEFPSLKICWISMRICPVVYNVILCHFPVKI